MGTGCYLLFTNIWAPLLLFSGRLILPFSFIHLVWSSSPSFNTVLAIFLAHTGWMAWDEAEVEGQSLLPPLLPYALHESTVLHSPPLAAIQASIHSFILSRRELVDEKVVWPGLTSSWHMVVGELNDKRYMCVWDNSCCPLAGERCCCCGHATGRDGVKQLSKEG